EAQAAIELEMISQPQPAERYHFELVEGNEIVIDPAPVLQAAVADLRGHVPASLISALFHTAVAKCIAKICIRLQKQVRQKQVALTGGVFQNVLLLKLTQERLLQA